MNKRPLMIGLLAVAGFGCEQRGETPSATTATAPGAAPSTQVAGQADGLDARETRLVMLKLPAMV